jgi:hypothetical protein
MLAFCTGVAGGLLCESVGVLFRDITFNIGLPSFEPRIVEQDLIWCGVVLFPFFLAFWDFLVGVVFY